MKMKREEHDILEKGIVKKEKASTIMGLLECRGIIRGLGDNMS